ncbi:nucleotidyl transferase AbiEii/AbiGii toxin family protein [Chryseolinea soli]|nr:nucleotidyl transferase AbiEii/AbiGii toxin family protein [Chryseolinea soli]
MENKTINIGVVKKIAIALKDLRERVAFVGGAVISLYTDDPAADELRPTKDIDLSVTLENYSAWVKLQDELTKLQFLPDTSSSVICRFLYDDITVDIMPDDEQVLGFSNPWYKPALQNMQEYLLQDGPTINIFSLPYFLATKFSAFNGRGKGDNRGSHDFEDIIYLTDNCIGIVASIQNTDADVQQFLLEEYRKIWTHPYRTEIISCHLSPLIRDARYNVIERKIESIIALEK